MTVEQAAAPERFWRRVLEYIDGRINPVLVKDLRLWMRGKLFIVLYILLVMLLMVGAGLYTYAAREMHFNGQSLWAILFGCCLVICGAIIPNMVYERFRSELKNRATELAFLSELTAGRIVRGKLFSAWAASLLVLSAAAPVFSAAYLLGGIDLLTALNFIIWLLWAAITMPTLQLMVATLGSHVGFRLFAILLLLAQVGGSIGTAVACYELIILKSGLYDDEFLFGASLILSGGLFSAYFFYQVAISRLRSDNENREMAPRLALLLNAFAGGGACYLLICFIFPSSVKSYGCIVAVTVYAFIFGVGFLFILRTTDHLSRGLCQVWPRIGLIRLLLYPGHRRLCAFLAVGYMPAFILMLVSLVDEPFFDIVHQGIYVMVPFLFLAVGLVVHDVLAIPFCKRRGLRPVAILSVLGANLVLLIIAGTGGILAHIHPSLRELMPIALSISPITAGLIIDFSRYDPIYAQTAGISVFVYAVVLLVVLCVIAFKAWWTGRQYRISGVGKYTIGSNSGKGV